MLYPDGVIVSEEELYWVANHPDFPQYQGCGNTAEAAIHDWMIQYRYKIVCS